MEWKGSDSIGHEEACAPPWSFVQFVKDVGMPLTQAEFEALLADESKTITGDVEWKDDEDRSPAVEFGIEVESDAGYPLMVCGSYNALARAATFALVHRGVGRIYALDIGKDHHNPECNHTGDTHTGRNSFATRRPMYQMTLRLRSTMS